MLNLYLLRHAKSSRAKPLASDVDRRLTGRGRRAAALMADHMVAKGLSADLVLCSPARRTRETLDVMSTDSRKAARVLFEDALYGGSAEGYLAAIHRHGGEARAILVIGHNPALEDLAGLLVGGGDKAARAAMAATFPAGALAHIAFDLADWTTVGRGSGRLVSFTRPRDLAPEGSP